MSRAITESILLQIAKHERDSVKKKKKKKKKNRNQTTKDKNKHKTKCKKWRLHPTASQEKMLRLWLDGVRFAYNIGVQWVNANKKTTLHEIREGASVGTGKTHTKKGEKKRPNRESMWNKFSPDRLKSVPPKLRDSALIDLYKACKTLWAKEKCFKRDMKFRTSKDYKQSFAVEKTWLNCTTVRSMWAPLFGSPSDRTVMRTEDGKSLPKTFEHDCRVVRERLSGHFYLVIPTELDMLVPETQGPECMEGSAKGHVVAIDPGVRTFATCYDPERARFVEWGMTGGRKNGSHDGIELLGWLSRKVARLERNSKLEHGQSRKRIRAVANRVRARVRNLTDELHHQLALWLCRNYELILLPKFSVKGVSRRKKLAPGKRRLMGSTSVRRLYQMSPFRFRQFLIHKAREYGTRVEICDEHFTTKTCSRCGQMHEVGAAKAFACSACGLACDRDFNASKNILLRYIHTHDVKLADEEKLEGRLHPDVLGGLV